MDMWVHRKRELENFEKMKEYNKTVIDWLLWQQQFCLTLERICCPQQILSRVKQNCCCPRTQSITVKCWRPYNSIQWLTEDAGWRQQILSRVKQNCCCPRSQSIIVFKIFLFTLSLTYPLDVFNILVRQVREYWRRLDIVSSIYDVTYWTNENKAIGQQFDSGL